MRLRYCFWAASLIILCHAPLSFSQHVYEMPPVSELSDAEIRQRLSALESQLIELRRLPPVSSLQVETLPAPEPLLSSEVSTQGSCQECDTKLVEADKFPTFAVTGFFHLDSAFFNQDAVNRATLGDIEDGAGFRRARLGAVGKVAENTSYIMEFDFGQAQPRFVDVWMQFAETPVGNVRLGRFRQPFGMTELTSARDLPFLERPTPFALAPFRQTGVQLSDTLWDEHVTYAISGYRYLSDNFGNVYADTGGYGTAARITGLPLDWGDDRLVHLGLGYSYNDPGRDEVLYLSTNEVFVGQQPNLGPSGFSVLPIVAVPPFVNTGVMPTTQTNLFNVEGAVSFGSLLLQSEARWAEVELTDGTTNTFPAFYAHLRYMLTGETIPYNRKTGVFGRVKPSRPANFACGDWGAWELAARISYIDLNGTGIPGPGRRLTDYTLGLNFYVNNFSKLQFNWIDSQLNDPTLGNSQAQTAALRAQIDF